MQEQCNRNGGASVTPVELAPIPADVDAEHTLCVLAELFTPCRDAILAAVADADLWSNRWRALMAGIRAGQPWPVDDPRKLDDLYGWVVQPERCQRVIDRVLDLARRRRLISAAAQLGEWAYAEGRPLDREACVRTLLRALGPREAAEPRAIGASAAPMEMGAVVSYSLDDLDLSA